MVIIITDNYLGHRMDLCQVYIDPLDRCWYRGLICYWDETHVITFLPGGDSLVGR